MSPVKIVLTALVVGALLTPVVRYLALKTGSVDEPEGHSSHRSAIPIWGGIGLYLAVMAAVVLWNGAGFTFQMSGVLVGATMVNLLGLRDDHRPIPAWIKLLVESAAAVVLIFSGIVVQLPIAMPLNWALTVLWVVGVTNAFNLIDNMDGLSAGIAAVTSSCFLLLSAWNGQILVASLSAAVLGASLGFLLYNFNPATIFLGDSGSLFLGFILAVTGIKIRFPENDHGITWLVPILVLAVPLFDTAFVSITRMMRRASPFTPGRDHVSHRLRKKLGSDRRAVLILYGVSAGCGAAAFLVSGSGPFVAMIVLGLAMTLGLGTAYFLYACAPPE